ncbi:MAG: hypothetical protein U1E20_03395 [Methylocystis sp.]|uniref:hypothetical protein n=1 Tax=Methylocystis sp. TaxID=1911079 RepID=UPI003956CFA5
MQWWVELTDIVRNLGLFVGGAFGLYLGWKRVTVANRQAEAQTRLTELTRRGHVAELVNRSVGQLGDEKLEIRLGAIFALRLICQDFPDWSQPIVQLLTIYLKENPVDYGDAEPPADVREIIRLVQSRTGTSK